MKKEAGHINSLFGTYRLSLARAILQLSVAEIASKYGYSKHTWCKYEEGVLRVSEETRFAVERDMRIKLKKVKVIA